MYNILIDIPRLKKEHGGVYQYSLALLRILAKDPSSYRFFVFCHNPDTDIQEIINKYPTFNLVQTKPSKYSKVKRIGLKVVNLLFKIIGNSKQLKKKDIYDCIIKEYNIDIVHTPTQSVVKKKGVKSITTLHDVQELHFPEFFTSKQRAHRAVSYKRAIDTADAVIVSYQHIKKDIKKYFDKKEDSIHVVLLDMKNLWFDKLSISSKTLTKLDLPNTFLLYPAATWEHKNHLILLKAINYLADSSINLICTGNITEFYDTILEPYIESNKLNDNVKFLGIVSDEELLGLYKKCRGVVIPTLYEAGSFPLMESILLETPVICSNVTSLPKTIGDSNFVFNPYSVEDVAKKIKKIWFDESYREKNIKNSKSQANKITNTNSSSKIYKIYEEILSK